MCVNYVRALREDLWSHLPGRSGYGAKLELYGPTGGSLPLPHPIGLHVSSLPIIYIYISLHHSFSSFSAFLNCLFAFLDDSVARFFAADFFARKEHDP